MWPARPAASNRGAESGWSRPAPRAGRYDRRRASPAASHGAAAMVWLRPAPCAEQCAGRRGRRPAGSRPLVAASGRSPPARRAPRLPAPRAPPPPPRSCRPPPPPAPRAWRAPHPPPARQAAARSRAGAAPGRAPCPAAAGHARSCRRRAPPGPPAATTLAAPRRRTGSGVRPAPCPGWRMGRRVKRPPARGIVRSHAPRAVAPSSAGAVQVVCAEMSGRRAARRPRLPMKPSLSWPVRGSPGRRPRRPSRQQPPGGARRSVRRRTPRKQGDPSSRCRRRPWASRLPASSRRCRAADVPRRSRPRADPGPGPVLQPRRRRMAGSLRSMPRVGPREPRAAPRRAGATRCARRGRRCGPPRRRAPSIRCRP